MPTKSQIEGAWAEIEAEDRQPLDFIIHGGPAADYLPPEHPEHICGIRCDGQDGASSYCSRIRRKLFGG